jgi:acyl dehydratase
LHNLPAKAFGFPKAIAHGMWLKARTLAAVEGRLPGAFTVDVTFKTPVLLPSTVELVAVQTEGRWTLDLHNMRSGKPHLTGEIR